MDSIPLISWFAQHKDPNKLFSGTTWKYIGEDRTVRLAKADASGAGAHLHTVSIGGHRHSVGIGAHSHSVSGVTENTGLGVELTVKNSYIKLMGWYRIS
ncbi:hypothetical protein [Sodalis glossinidius]|uniref:hypothetical protein n=1 Tax=Sodalis glossinidius TaxID=63612 RepID=UPI0009FBAC57|nr:hypothetical protein [Sodalis glossinidius]